MKKSFVFMSIFIVITFVTVMAVPVFATTGSITLNSITMEKDIPGNMVTFTVNYTATNVDYFTILATRSDTKVSAPVPSRSNIVYINQKVSDSSIYVFKIPYDRFSEQRPYCWIEIGGTPILDSQTELLKVYDPLQDLIDTGESSIQVTSRIACHDDDYVLNEGQNLSIENFYLKNASVDTGETGSITLNKTNLTGVVKFDSNGRVYAGVDNKVILMKANSVGFIIAKNISSQSSQEFTITATGKENKPVTFDDLSGINGTVVFGVTICNIPESVTVDLLD